MEDHRVPLITESYSRWSSNPRQVSCRQWSEMQKVKTFTLAAFWGPKNLRQKCVIRDKFNAIKSAWFATNWILKRLKKHYLCSKFKKKPWNYIQSAKYLQFMNIYTQNCVIRDKVIFLHHHLSRSPSEFLHQLGLFYTSSASTASTFLHLCVQCTFTFIHWYYVSPGCTFFDIISHTRACDCYVSLSII